jgi:hypothetical protein
MNQYSLPVCIALFAASLTLLGCQEANPLPDSPAPAAAEFTMATAVHPDVVNTMSDADVERMVGANLQSRVAINRVVTTAATWQEADAGVRALLAEAEEPHIQYVREQSAAAIMLRARLLSGTPSPERADAIAYYTRMLVNNRSPEASLVAEALQKLEGHVDAAVLAEMADAAVASAEVYLAGQLDCEGCSSEMLQERLGPALGGRALAGSQSVVDGIDALRAFKAQLALGA